MSGERLGPWIIHEGGRPTLKEDGDYIFSEWHEGGAKVSAKYDDGPIGPDWPGFYWSWQTRGWFKKRRVPVCDDPRFMPIMKYRYVYPPGESASFEQVRKVVADPSAPIDAPEIQPKPIKKKERTPWGTYR